MIKKFLSATLFGFLMLGLAGTFVACDDYDDSDLRRRVEAIETRVRDKKKQEANMKKIGNLAGILYIYG